MKTSIDEWYENGYHFFIDTSENNYHYQINALVLKGADFSDSVDDIAIEYRLRGQSHC